MIRKGLLFKILGSLLGITLIIFLAIILQLFFLLKKDFTQQLLLQQSNFAETFGVAVGTGLRYFDPYFTASFVDEMAEKEGVVFFRVVDWEGQIRFADQRELVGKKVFLPEPEPDQSIYQDGAFEGERIKEIVSSFLMEGRKWRIWQGISLKGVRALVFESIFLTFILIISVITLGMGTLSFLVFRFILNPLQIIKGGIKKFSRGRFEEKIELETRDELEDLANTFNEMAEDLRKSHRALEEAKTVLEIKVEARTKELRELAESLEEKVKERTKEIQERVEELERFQRVAVGRELKMVELKKRIKELGKKLKKEIK